MDTADSQPGPQTEAGDGQPVLALRHAAKSFGAVQALIDGSVELRAGEAHALVGENGAGKSTLVKMLAGVHRPDGGTLVWTAGGPLHGPAAASAAGIAVIYQEPTLFPDLTVAENIFMAASRCGPGGGSTARRCGPRRPRCSPGSACRSTRRGSRAGCPSPTSRWSRSPRRCRWTRG